MMRYNAHFWPMTREIYRQKYFLHELTLKNQLHHRTLIILARYELRSLQFYTRPMTHVYYLKVANNFVATSNCVKEISLQMLKTLKMDACLAIEENPTVNLHKVAENFKGVGSDKCIPIGMKQLIFLRNRFIGSYFIDGSLTAHKYT